MTDEKNGRVFSGARPTGRQHLGNYLGAIQNYVALQEEYESIYCIVDVHALTTQETTQDLKANTVEMALDWLAAGMDPDKSIIFVQSHVPEVMAFHTILSMVTPLGKLTALPTFKEKVRENPNNVNYGLVGYPVLMAADILLYKATTVPVGVDQIPHVEFTREVVRSFHHRYQTDILVEPVSKVTQIPKVLGIDGQRKMSKSLDNHIELAATPERTTERVMEMVTDPQRIRLSDPGNPDVCNVFTLHKIFSDEEDVEEINQACRKAEIGCVACKRRLAESLNEHLAPFRARRNELEENPDYVRDVLAEGAEQAHLIAAETMAEVRSAVGFYERGG
ncbi:MAG: tryptophan--tRNA ligase [Anaerolineales bacterium]